MVNMLKFSTIYTLSQVLKSQCIFIHTNPIGNVYFIVDLLKFMFYINLKYIGMVLEVKYMRNNFNKIIDRRNTNSLKYDFAVEKGKPEGIIPLWIADMDFKTSGFISKEIKRSIQHGIFGYSDVKDDYFQAISRWFEKKHGWKPESSWLVKTPGVVFSIAIAIKALTEEGDGIIIQQPVYYPFSEIVIKNNRKLIINPLIYDAGKYSIDFIDFEDKIVKNNIKLFFLCNPHNPVGRVWTYDELKRLGTICLKHNVTVISDEIHCDFTYQGHKHIVFSSISEEFANNSIICTSPSKSFNLAGLQVSNIFIKNPKIRDAFNRTFEATGYSQLNTVGLVACKAAYEKGEVWLEQLKEYITGNLNYLRSFLKENLPEIKLVEPEGTYLIWLDFKELNYTKKELAELIVNKANLWLSPGYVFGKEGENFERINIACPRKILIKALKQLNTAIRHT